MGERRQTLMPRKSVINRRMSYRVVPCEMSSRPRPESQGFRDLHGINKDVVSQEKPREIIDISILDVSEEESMILTGLSVVLSKCKQDFPLEFDTAFSKRYLKKCSKIGEGLYGEVFMYKARNESTVFKIIPVDGEDAINEERQKCCTEILSEIVIASELSDLRYDDKNQTSGFVEVVKNMLLRGRYPQPFIDMWKLYDKKKGSENDCPSIFQENQLFLVMELAHGGVDLEKFHFRNAEESLAVFLQTAHALAVAEASCQFEHRDLHWGNVLLSRSTNKAEHYMLNGESYKVPTKGIKVSIIDFTLSRMTTDGCCLFNDLSLDPSIFESEGDDYQFDIYRKMRDECRNDWSKFCPFNNILWLHYLLLKMIDETGLGIHYNQRVTQLAKKEHGTGMRKLKQLEKSLLTFKSVVDFVQFQKK